MPNVLARHTLPTMIASMMPEATTSMMPQWMTPLRRVSVETMNLFLARLVQVTFGLSCCHSNGISDIFSGLKRPVTTGAQVRMSFPHSIHVFCGDFSHTSVLTVRCNSEFQMKSNGLTVSLDWTCQNTIRFVVVSTMVPRCVFPQLMGQACRRPSTPTNPHLQDMVKQVHST